MLRIWTSDQSHMVKDVLGKTLSADGGVSYQIHPFNTEVPQLMKEDTLFALGSKSLGVLQEKGILPKNRTIASLRSKAHSIADNGSVLMVSYNPSIYQRDYSMLVNLKIDTRLAMRVENTGSIEPKIGKYQYVKDFSETILKIKELLKANKGPLPVSIDLETLGLNPYNEQAFIVSISVTYRKGQADMIRFYGHKDQPAKGGKVYLATLWHQIDWLLNCQDLSVRGANFKYDLNWMDVKWDMECTNFKFDTTIVGSLLDENRSNSLNTHAKIYTAMGGYDDCVTPDTLVCTSDLRWVPIGDVKEGDSLVGFDEDCEYRKRRRMRVSKAVSTKRLVKEGYRITLTNGREIKCSTDHGFLACKYKTNGPYEWLRAYELRVGSKMQPIIPVDSLLGTYESGYVSGLYDREGYVSNGGLGIQSGISQKPGEVWTAYCVIMQSVGLGGFYANAKNIDGVMTSKHTGWPTLRMLQIFRPLRLLSKNCYDGKCVPSTAEKIYVSKIEKIGAVEVVSLETDTHTFVTEGICSHNSFNAKHDKSRMDLVPDDDLLVYGGGDTDADYQVAGVMKSELLKDKKLAKFYIKLLHPAGRSFERMEQEGVLLDVPYYMKLQTELTGELVRLEKKAFGCMPRRLVHKHAHNLKLTRGAIISEFMFSPKGLNLTPKVLTEKTKQPATDKKHLMMFKDHPDAGPFIEALSEYTAASKTLSTYVVGFMKHLRSDGRFHPTAILYKGDYGGTGDSGTITGRLAFKDPAIQTLPKHTKWAPKLRRGYIAPEGYVIVSWDYSQGELRVMACLANEPNMIAAYEAGIDLHLKTGAELNGFELEAALEMQKSEDVEVKALIKKIRQGGKAGNFGLIYRMSAPGFQQYAKDTYGVDMTMAEAESQHHKFLYDTYSRIPEYHKEQIGSATFNGYVRSPLGRIRHLPLINSKDNQIRSQSERQSINSPTQATLSDLSQFTLVEFDKTYGYQETCRFFNMTHDSLGAYVREDRVDSWIPRVTEIMSNLPIEETFGWKPQLQFLVDAEMGPNLADMVEL